MELKLIRIEKPENMNFILGMSHFIKTVEDIHEVIVQTAPAMKFGLAFCEASGPCLVRVSGNDSELEKLAAENALNIGAGHSFIIFMDNGFPINILNAVKQVPEVCRIFCATANSASVLVVADGNGRGIAGVIDGMTPAAVESGEDVAQRKQFLRDIGYKF